MIRFLRIKNLATIEDLQVNFGEGFSILTGETGAGKSIIIDSIRLVCGEKGSPDLVRTGTEEASVEVIFSIPEKVRPRERPASGEDTRELTVQRMISGEASGKAYCDGVLIPVKKLKEVSGDLVDIYGQNDHIFLLHLENHLDYLDHAGGSLALREDVAQAAQELRRLIRLRNEWKTKERERSQRLDFLEFQIREIEKANLRVGEEEALRGQRHILKNVEKITALVDKALSAAYTEEPSLTSLLAKLQSTLTELSTFDQKFAEANDSLNPLAIVLQELSDFLMKYKDKQEITPDKLEEIEERLSSIEALKRKYGSQIEDIQFYLEKIKQEHDELAQIQDKLARVEAEVNKTFDVYRSKSSHLSVLRQKAARDLEKLIEKEISQLGMRKARFHIKIETAVLTPDLAEKAKDSGIDAVEFMISPNPGEEVKPLRKIASGGELSRIMLALKAVGKEKGSGRTLIFDEIDSGIGGKTAEFIAQKLRTLSKNHQILCITHLPQIASFASHHYRIEKKIEKERTFTSMKKLDFEDRVEEIARLMSGSRITELTLENARDMLHHNLRES
jgi:DNA repair protein RecN (Recombination protein N)